ncbi:MAG: hypothetical protein WD068_01525 [Candidatus Babeliales bacterium]
MTANPFQSFIDLITFDTSIRVLEDVYKKNKDHVAALQNSIDQINTQADHAKQAYRQMRKQVDEQELIMKELNQHESDCKKKLEVVQNQKEYKAIMSELETIQAQQQNQEVTLLSGWNTVEQAEKVYQHKAHEMNAQRTELEQQFNEKSQLLEQSRQEFEQHEEQRKEKLVGVNKEWLEQYTAMRSRVANPVVPVRDGMCTACYLSMPAQTLADLRRHKLLQCRQCFRFLYLEETPSESK